MLHLVSTDFQANTSLSGFAVPASAACNIEGTDQVTYFDNPTSLPNTSDFVAWYKTCRRGSAALTMCWSLPQIFVDTILK
jgi:hypothetical protein